MNAEARSLLIELTSGDDQRAELAVSGLSAQGNIVIPALREMLASNESDSRWWAVRCLAQMENPPLDLLVGSLEDASQEVRQCAALAISNNPDISSIQSLMGLMQEIESVTTNLAATALIAIGKEAIPELLELLPDLKEGCRIEAYRAIACIADQRAIPVLMSALEEDSLTINYWAEEGLKRLGLDMVYLKPD